MGGGIVTVVSIYPARRRTSPLGVVPAGLGDGVGDCHDVANLPKVCLFISHFSFSGDKPYSFLKGYDFRFFYSAGYASS